MFCLLGTLALLHNQGDTPGGKKVVEVALQALQNLGFPTSFNQAGAVLALGILSVLTSFVFFADLIFVLNNPKFSLWKK